MIWTTSLTIAQGAELFISGLKKLRLGNVELQFHTTKNRRRTSKAFLQVSIYSYTIPYIYISLEMLD